MIAGSCGHVRRASLKSRQERARLHSKRVPQLPRAYRESVVVVAEMEEVGTSRNRHMGTLENRAKSKSVLRGFRVSPTRAGYLVPRTGTWENSSDGTRDSCMNKVPQFCFGLTNACRCGIGLVGGIRPRSGCDLSSVLGWRMSKTVRRHLQNLVAAGLVRMLPAPFI